MTELKDESEGSSKARTPDTNRWRKAGEVSVLILKILAGVATVLGALVSWNGCGPA